MIAFTLDTNCIIDLEESRPFAESVQALVTAHREGRATVAIPAIMAAERQRDGLYLETIEQFFERLRDAGLEDLPLIEAIADYGVSFYGRGYYGGTEEMNALEDAVQAIVHPNIERGWRAYCEAHGVSFDPPNVPPQWRNARCDVQTMWSHIFHRRDVFVTSDTDFLKTANRDALVVLGAGRILQPTEAAALLG